MRRTCVLINTTGLGGAERRFGRLFARVADEDAETCLVVNAGLWRKLLAAGIVTGHEDRVWPLPEPLGYLVERIGAGQSPPAFWLRKLDYLLFAFVMTVRYTLARRRVFHLVLGGTYVALPLLVWRPDHRFVVSVTNPRLDRMVGDSWALRVYLFALRRCTAIDALTEGVREDLLRRGIAGGKILVSGGSVVDGEHFHPGPDKNPWVVFAGRLIEDKNPLLFIETIPSIRQAVPAARFFLLGDGRLRRQVEEAVERTGCRDLVEVGFRPDTSPVLSRARVFVSLQRQDNYPSQSLLEAMACGAVPVATDVGLTWKLVDDTTGVRVKPDPGQIADAVIGLLKEPERCARLGRAARRRVEEQHSEGMYRAHLDRLYARAATCPEG